MRPKERIDKFFSLFIQQIERTGLKPEEKKHILDNQKQILEYWKENPDQRLTQMLFNTTGIMHYHGWNYHKEDDSYLQLIGIDPRDLVIWGSYGKEGKGPLTYLWIDDITTDHMQAILRTQKNIHPMYKVEFEKELRKRGEEVPTKYGTIKGEMLQLYEVMEMSSFKGFTSSYLQNIDDFDSFYDDYEDAGLELFVEFNEGELVDGIYFEITEAMSKDLVIQVMETMLNNRPDFFERKSKNVYFINWL